ncbi:MAG: tRNA uridine-5-carboxymethylaminomethyl(34) synthesis enzyme MnmG [Chlorobi bacterium]|nr:tRNA uridine-5-carboxymethylaminomethyl(34) synthesis enzyme MnmG [Chlorobiota bacterium]
MIQKYDVIVVGAGHAGCEAAAAAAKLCGNTLLLTMDMTKMAQMSCNPAMGGIAKGQIIREIDALGGYSAEITDKSTIQFRMLNKSKGPAMWSPRAQCDRTFFSLEWRKTLENIKGLDFYQDLVTALIFENKTCKGVITKTGIKFYSKTVILTNGTFLNGLMHVGKVTEKGGRNAEPESYGLSDQIEKFGIEKGRMKTGTPARLDGRTINFTELIEQEGDEDKKVNKFSYKLHKYKRLRQRNCFITHTSKFVHDELKKGFGESPLFNGRIKSIGPRYCPSIEDKIVTFSDKDSHHLFLEPEGEDTIEWYINGFSSSLPWDIQLKGLRKIKGLENVKIFRPGYAIEYDYFLPTQLYHTLESKKIENLFFAGQINGTTGYEEAAAQGLIAGINAAKKIKNEDEFVLKREEAYIGVLIDDLVTKGVDEPYRMFTSRAEFRILLRQDNADARLSEKGYSIGLLAKDDYNRFLRKKKEINIVIEFCKKYSVSPNEINNFLIANKTQPIKQRIKLERIVLRPQVDLFNLYKEIEDFVSLVNNFTEDKEEILSSAEIILKYDGYITREKIVAEKIKRLENIRLNREFDYDNLKSLSTEAKQKLNRIKPSNIGQASRISGISPSDINVILISIGR